MRREWFELARVDGGPSYVHSRTRTFVGRTVGMTDIEWAEKRAAFFASFPLATEIRSAEGYVIGSVDCMPAGDQPLFARGDVLSLRFGGLADQKHKVVGIQMPLPGCGEHPAYLLEDGSMVLWSRHSEGWVIRRDREVVVEGFSKAPARRAVRARQPAP